MSERNMRALLDLMKKNNDWSLRFVGVYFDVNKAKIVRVWEGLGSYKYYLECKDSCCEADYVDISLIREHLIDFDKLKELLEKESDGFREAIRFGAKKSLVEVLVENDDCEIEYGGYFRGMNFRLWYSLKDGGGYIETVETAYKQDDPRV